ncbi:MAG TPA: SdrD B-like domain-containing protein [Vicinamibacterales bacterium]
MLQDDTKTELKERTQWLLDGPLKHVRAAALAAALLPLASIVATPASAQTAAPCMSGGTCGTVYTDTNGNGIIDTGDTPIEGATVTACAVCDGTDTLTVTTDLNGAFQFLGTPLDSTFSFYVMIPTGTSPSPIGPDHPDNIGTSNGAGFSVAPVPLGSNAANFGFVPTAAAQPGTGTPGYWKNHPEAWPVGSIMVGNVTYTKAQAISLLGKTGKDKTITMFQSLVSAMLSVMVGNDGSCISAAIMEGNKWLMANPVGSNVAGGSAAWTSGDPIHITLDAYDNGLLCAPHRQ